MTTNDDAVTPESALALASEWSELLETLVPPDSVEVEDITGAKHRLRASLPAAVEMRIIRCLQQAKLPDLMPVADRMLQAQGDTQETLAGVLDGIATLLGDEGILQAVAESFAMAHPRAMREATENVLSDPDTRDYVSGSSPSASELFSTTDLLSGLVPFVLRAVSRIGATAATLLPSPS